MSTHTVNTMITQSNVKRLLAYSSISHAGYILLGLIANNQTGLIAIENTQNLAGGSVMSFESMQEITDRAHRKGLPVHLDGARIFNAAIVLKRDVAEIASLFDSVMFCLSKGLGAPVGSLLCGSSDVIAEARRQRRRLGGGMRQAGVIAAAGVVALETMVERLADDHARAARLADALADRWPGSVDPATVRTNIVCARLEKLPDDFIARLATLGVRTGTIDPRTVRLVTHKDVDDDDIASVIKAFDQLAAAG